MAARLETGQLRANLGVISDQGEESTVSRDDAVVTGWYGSNRRNLQAGIRFLSRLRDDVGTNGRVRDFFKDDLLTGFGAHFYDQLNAWLPVNIDLIGFTNQMFNHSHTYNIPLPDEKPKVVVDIRERLHMVLKLIEQKSRHLQDLEQSYEQRNATSREGSTDLAPRFFSSAARDLHRAVDWFSHLKGQRM